MKTSSSADRSSRVQAWSDRHGGRLPAPVMIVDYDPEWPRLFARIAEPIPGGGCFSQGEDEDSGGGGGGSSMGPPGTSAQINMTGEQPHIQIIPLG